MAAGTAEGKMLLRLDWDERTRSEECGNSYLNDIKFSNDAQVISVASVNKNIYIFIYNEEQGTYLPFDYAPLLEKGFPLSINFNFTSDAIAVFTNKRQRTVMKPQDKDRQLMSNSEDFEKALWN